jgi:hypothetical protein
VQARDDVTEDTVSTPASHVTVPSEDEPASSSMRVPSGPSTTCRSGATLNRLVNADTPVEVALALREPVPHQVMTNADNDIS